MENRDEQSPALIRGRLKTKLAQAQGEVNGAAVLLSKFDPSKPKANRGEFTLIHIVKMLEDAKDRRKDCINNLELFEFEQLEKEKGEK